jgi:lipoprotein-anchoring transpeptidase ErfK/SrfK
LASQFVMRTQPCEAFLSIFEATIGSRELPSPSGTYKVKGVAYNPIYYYDPDKNFVQGGNNEKLRLPPGPNNPVGSVYIALTKPTYGLHGTPDLSRPLGFLASKARRC